MATFSKLALYEANATDPRDGGFRMVPIAEGAVQALDGLSGGGPPGPAGPQGVAGPAGSQGLQGDIGPQGPAGNNGAAGPQGIQGLKGDTGNIGPQGPTGTNGTQGIQGIQGIQGTQGVQGVPGPGLTGAAATSATTGTMTVVMDTGVKTITPTGACTFNASGGNAGELVTFSVTTSGTSSFVLTWGTNFRKTGTLATGTTSARFFTVSFRCVAAGVWSEIGRTAVQT